MDGIGKNLKRIRLLKKLSLRDAGALLNMTAPAISKYENGDIVPNSEKLIEFANAYGVRVIDLLKTYNVPEMKFNSFRKKKRLTGKNLQLLEELIQDEVAKYIEVIELNDINKTNTKLKKYLCNSLEDAEEAANKFRADIKISNKQPIFELINILENLDVVIILVKNYDNRFDDFDGLSEMVNNIPIIVLLDDIRDGARQRFTIAHELGHLVLNVSSELDEEAVCSRFASAFLMPKEAVINEFGITRKNISFFELKAFKREYKVSYSAILYRLRDLNVISEYLYKKLCIFLSQSIGKNDPEPIIPEISYQFKRLVYKLEVDGIITLNKACELLGVSIDEYNNEDNNYRH